LIHDRKQKADPADPADRRRPPAHLTGAVVEPWSPRRVAGPDREDSVSSAGEEIRALPENLSRLA